MRYRAVICRGGPLNGEEWCVPESGGYVDVGKVRYIYLTWPAGSFRQGEAQFIKTERKP